jgi:hypothetical protein
MKEKLLWLHKISSNPVYRSPLLGKVPFIHLLISHVKIKYEPMEPSAHGTWRYFFKLVIRTISLKVQTFSDLRSKYPSRNGNVYNDVNLISPKSELHLLLRMVYSELFKDTLMKDAKCKPWMDFLNHSHSESSVVDITCVFTLQIMIRHRHA